MMFLCFLLGMYKWSGHWWWAAQCRTDNSLKSEGLKECMLVRGDTIHATIPHTQVIYLLMWDRRKLWPDFGKMRNSEK